MIRVSDQNLASEMWLCIVLIHIYKFKEPVKFEAEDMVYKFVFVDFDKLKTKLELSTLGPCREAYINEIKSHTV